MHSTRSESLIEPHFNIYLGGWRHYFCWADIKTGKTEVNFQFQHISVYRTISLLYLLSLPCSLHEVDILFHPGEYKIFLKIATFFGQTENKGQLILCLRLFLDSAEGSCLWLHRCHRACCISSVEYRAWRSSQLGLGSARLSSASCDISSNRPP